MENVILHALLSLSYTGRAPEPPVAFPGEVCFDPFGCFSVEQPWAGTSERPVAALPMPLNVTTPIFCFHTPSEPSCHEWSLQNIGNIYTSSLERTAPLYVITHGYMETSSLSWMVKMRKTLLKVSPNVGVVVVDWSSAAHPPYAQSVANIRLAGAVTGYLLHLLVEFYDVPLSNIHLVGHSLGAHFMGYAGDFVRSTTGRKVGRITGLDPAGPYFVNVPPEVRLDPNDAEFVDVIHTDIPKELWQINRLGHPDPIGHVDYYPNGGFRQAGCVTSAHAHVEEQKSLAYGVMSYIGCNHQRSHGFFTESILSKCKFLGVICKSWKHFLQGSCWGCANDQCSVMGFHATPLKAGHYRTSERGIQNRSTEDSKIHDYIDSEKSAPSIDEDSANYKDDQGVTTRTLGSSSDSFAPLVKIYLGTKPNTPFCAEQYRVTIVTSKAMSSQQSDGDVARFTLRVRGQYGEHTIPPSEKPTFIEPGGQQSWLGFSAQLGPLIALQVDYEEDQGFLHSLIWRFSPPHLFVDSFIVDELSTGLTTHFQFCGKMEAGESHVLFPDKSCEYTSEEASTISKILI